MIRWLSSSCTTQLDAVASEAVLAAIFLSFNGFDAVLDDICKRLSQLATVAHHAEIALRRVEDEAESRGAPPRAGTGPGARSRGRSRRGTAGLGMRAKFENSSTMRRRSPTCRTIVPVSRSNVSLSELISSLNRRCSRSAASWMGVSGFLISCAIRRAMSDHAARRWSVSWSVMSSKVRHRPVLIPHALHRQRPLAGCRRQRSHWLRTVAAHELVEVWGDDAQPLPFDFLLLVLKQGLSGAVDEQDAVAGSRARSPQR